MNYPEAFQDLVDCFKRLPGIGSKSAERLTYYVLSMEKDYVNDFSKAIGNIQDKIHYCKKCGHICEGEICDICMDHDRDQSIICVVEESKDVFAMEKIKEYNGVYHVLHGTMSIMDGKTMDDLNIDSLFERLDDSIK